ncbi:unnamed protein product [Caenorhabditis auriculariae]|uniref:E3 UFM1-protein ligase 1 homolog n=1 Tax=Caenorhabditis auriculariae TaxID=2777116 RepID=A0A8S1H8I2_9PELO|nr:unnamed protein product [Caenorhabditis auriculariae]
MTSWADIQRLASDLQRVQLSQSSKKLSEANCVEVVTKLIEKSLINVVFTRDGQSYITKKHLETEVKNECVAAGGRAPLTDIATSLNVDFDHVDRIAKLVVVEDSAYTLSNGEIFATEYVHQLQSELRNLLEEHGSQTLASLCKQWDLSQELLQSLLLSKLPQDFNGVIDGDTIYTKEFLNSRKMLLRAVLVAITKVTPISTIQQRVALTPKRFWMAMDELIEEAEVPGRIVGSRTSPSCHYSPFVHEMLVNICVQNSLRQNEYLQLGELKKLGVDGVNGVGQILGKQAPKLFAFSSLLLTESLHEQCAAAVKEELQKSKICEVRSVLQAMDIPVDDADADKFGEAFASRENNVLFAEGFLFSNNLLSDATAALEEQIEKKAHEELDRIEKEKKTGSGGKTTKKTEDDEDWGDGKKGGKKKGKSAGGGKAAKPKGAEKNEPSSHSVAISSEELEQWLRDGAVVPEEILDTVVDRISSDVTGQLRKRVAELAATQLTANAQSQKRNLAAIADRAQQIYTSFCSFEASTESFVDPLQFDLKKYLLRNVGVELANGVLAYVTGIDNAHQLKEKQKEETIEELPDVVREPLKKLFSSVKAESLDDFHDAVHDCSLSSTIGIRKADKKARSDFNAKLLSDLRQQVEEQKEPAACLLLVVLFFFAKAGKPLTASGKFVASLIPQLQESCTEETMNLLTSCQKLVVTCMKNKDNEDDKKLLDEAILSLKNLDRN